MIGSVDIEVQSTGGATHRVRLRTGEVLGRHQQPGLEDPRISRTAARLAEDAQGLHLDGIASLYDLQGAHLDRLGVEVGAQACLSDDGDVRLRVVRVSREQPSLCVQRLGDPPMLLHGPAWRLSPGAPIWLHPAELLRPFDLGFLATGDDGWTLQQPDRPARPLRPGDELRFGVERLFLLPPPPVPASQDATLRRGTTKLPTFSRSTRRKVIEVRHGDGEVAFTGAAYHALHALLQTPGFTDSDLLATTAQRGWRPNNLNVAIHEVRSKLSDIGVNLDDYYQKANGARRFRLIDPSQLVELDPEQ